MACPLGDAALAQQGATVNPVPGSVWTYLGPTLGADWTTPPGTTITQQAANLVYAGPASGPAALPTFRPLTLNDLPTVNSNIGTYQGLTVNNKGLVTAATNMNYAPLASPAFTSIPTAPTASPGTSTTQIATTAFVTGQGYLPGPPPAAPANNNWLARWTSGGGMDSAYSTSNSGNLIGTLVESNTPGAWGSHILHVGSVGAGNNAVFGVNMNAAPGTTAFPAGATGYGRVSAGSNGNTVFGVYGLGELYAATGTVVAAEFTARNLSSSTNVDRNLPPDNAIPNSTISAKGVNITCGSQGLGDCSVGLHISNENGNAASPIFNTAEYIQLYQQYGLFVEAMPSGNQTGIVVKNNGSGTALQILSTAEPSPLNAIFSVVNHLSSNLFSVTYAGSFRAAGTGTISGLPTSGGGGGLYVCVDSAGALYKKAACP
jgi:hypothetical protein